MNKLWKNIILPIIEQIDVHYIVEVGSEYGINTKNILQYCLNNNASMTTIDPFPKFNIDEFKAKYGDKFEIYKDLSLSRLPLLKDYEVILIDGDHNWYTVYNELKIIEKSFKNKRFPLVFLHDVGWPYARRDLYYNPENIPPQYRQPYKQLGIVPGKSNLLEEGGLNQKYNNAIYENNPKNGVLTAIEDFIGESDLDLSFETISAFMGLGILYLKNEEIDKIIQETIKNADLEPILEQERVKLFILSVEAKKRVYLLRNKVKELNNELGVLGEDFERVRAQLSDKDKLLSDKDNELGVLGEDFERVRAQLKDKEINEKELNSKINNLMVNLYEIEYLSNKGRTVTQKLKSKFPSIYILLKINKTGFKQAFANIKGYKAIKENNLLDIGYYLKKYKDVRSSGMDPILHYMYYGYNEGKRPSPHFDGEYYLQIYGDVKASRLNPLVHYSLYGMKEERDIMDEGREYEVTENHVNGYSALQEHQLQIGVPSGHWGHGMENLTDNFAIWKGPRIFREYSHQQIEKILEAFREKDVSIIIPIYNAFDDTKKCIYSVLEHTKIPYELILIDDCSSDERIGSLLDKMEEIPQVKVIRNKENKGFVKNVNIGIQNSTGDIVLLNSDTNVTSKWLQKLVVAAYSDEKIGTVTPFSNAAGAFSVPKIGKENEIPDILKLEGMANLVEKVSENFNMEVPTGNGFCMFIKRSVIHDVGLFDEETFGQGYGEENDFCMRALDKSWTNIIDDSTYIYHKRSASFSSLDKELVEKIKRKNRTLVDKKHANYTNMVKEFVLSKKYTKIREKIKNALNEPNLDKFNRKRLLYVIHEGHGGTPHTNDDLMSYIQKESDCYVLSSSSKEVILWKYSPDYREPTQTEFELSANNESTKVFHKEFRYNLDEICSWKIKSKWSADEFSNSEFRNIYFNVLTGLKIDVVHIRHLIKHTFDLPDMARILGLPIILSFHDFYFICPSHLLLDENNVYCAGQCTEGQGQCFLGLELMNLPILKNFVKEWRSMVTEVLNKCDAFVTTAEIIKELYISIYPELQEQDFVVIEHGRDFKSIEDTSQYYKAPSENEPIKILFPGNINVAKGGELIKNIKKEDVNNRLEYHFMGALQGSLHLEKYGIFHGRYKRSDFCKMVKKIQPNFIGIFSINPETYVHTLSEAWSCGVPVLATKLGVMEERINKNGGGWLLELDPSQAFQEILRIADSPEEYNEVSETVKDITLVSTHEMADAYWELYMKYLYKNPHVDVSKV